MDTLCPKSKYNPNYSCRFCHTKIHRGDSSCGCSTFRESTNCASLCIPCAAALDLLTANTRLGIVHHELVRAEYFKNRHGDD